MLIIKISPPVIPLSSIFPRISSKNYSNVVNPAILLPKNTKITNIDEKDL